MSILKTPSYWVFFILYSVIYIINVLATQVSIKNEKDLTNSLIKSTNILTINIDNLNIDINGQIKIDHDIEKLSIIGSSKEKSILNFNRIQNGFNFTNSVKEIEINSVTINGKLEFNNNQNVTFENCVLNGVIESHDGSKNNKFIQMNNINFNCKTSLVYNCMNLCGNVKIENSSFIGHPSCQDSIMHYNGERINSISIKNSFFNGIYKNNCIDISEGDNLNVQSSHFENCVAYLDGGGSVRAREININVSDCEFKNSFTKFNGGVFNIKNAYSFKADKINAYNSTALVNGSFLYVISSSDYKTTAQVYNSKHIGCNLPGIKSNFGGLVASAEGFSSIIFDNFYSENLNIVNTIGAFTLDQSSSIYLRNIEMRNVHGYGVGGTLFNCFNENVGARFSVTNGTFTDFYQHNEIMGSLLIWISQNVEVTFKDCYFNNLYGEVSTLIYANKRSVVTGDNLNVNGFTAKRPTSIFRLESYNEDETVKFTMDKLSINNVHNLDAVFRTNYVDIKINDSIFSNINNNVPRDKYLTFADGNEYFFLDAGDGGNVVITNSTIENEHGTSGFRVHQSTYVTIKESTIKNCSFKNGIILIDEETYRAGQYNIKNTHFINNTGYNGVAINVKSISKNSKVTFNNSTFVDNHALNYGGVIYSNSIDTNLFVYFYSCDFSNNTAVLGDISYSLKKENEPNFTNIDELRKIQGAFMTNPTRIQLSDDSIRSISLLSGESITNEIKCNLYDDYDNLCKINSDINTLQLNEMVFFNVEVNDTNNLAIIGQSISYCWDNSCTFPLIKVIGNPGNYKLTLKLITFGAFNSFDNKQIDIDVTIKQCNLSQYIYQDIEQKNFKSCYLPSCSPPCNSGVCVNNNVCDCRNTAFTGLYCNEYYKLERIRSIDVIIKLISIMIIGISLIFMAGIYLLRTDPKIKSASIDFMFIILVGIIISSFYSYIISFEKKTKSLCTLAYLYNNVGFTLVFGSILVKTYRIYKIFTCVKKDIGLKKKYMYEIICGILSIHLIMLLIWIIADGIRADVAYTTDLKEFTKCFYHKSKNLSVVLNIIVLAVGAMFSYAIRGVKDNFKEQLSVPVYTYVLFTIIMEIVNMEDDINVNVQDFFNAIGTIINILVTLYYLYFTKFYDIYISYSIDAKKQGSSISLNDLLKKSTSSLSLNQLNTNLKTSNSSAFLNYQLKPSNSNVLLNQQLKPSNSNILMNQQLKASNSSLFLNHQLKSSNSAFVLNQQVKPSNSTTILSQLNNVFKPSGS